MEPLICLEVMPQQPIVGNKRSGIVAESRQHRGLLLLIFRNQGVLTKIQDKNKIPEELKPSLVSFVSLRFLKARFQETQSLKHAPCLFSAQRNYNLPQKPNLIWQNIQEGREWTSLWQEHGAMPRVCLCQSQYFYRSKTQTFKISFWSNDASRSLTIIFHHN